MSMEFERHKNVSDTLVFRQIVEPQAEGYLDIPIVAHGYVTGVKVSFASGENGTLQLRPVIIIPQDIQIDLFKYADGGLHYLSGDDEMYRSVVKREVENHTIARVYYKNTGAVGTADSFLNVDITVEYFEVVEPRNIIG